ncbi:MAG: extracellular solute-binding protein [bacterium]|nr:extracellular solute-binding protein [bacterium]
MRKSLLKSLVLVIALIIAVASLPAEAVEPAWGDGFNIETEFDFASLTQDNFYDVIVPLAKAEGSFVFFDFTNSFAPLWTEHIIPLFEEKYGIKVEHHSVDRDLAVQQMMAAKNAGQPSPVDLFFISAPQTKVLMDNGLAANIPLHTLLPNARELDQTLATVTNGVNHGGYMVPFHLNQTALGYDSRFVKAEELPTTFDELLAWAKANPGKFAATSPLRGGSGEGTMEGLMLHYVEGSCRDALSNFDITDEEVTAWIGEGCLDPVAKFYKEFNPVVEITNGNSDTLNLIANGEAYMGTVWEDMAYDFIGRGLLPRSVRFFLLKDGQVGGGDGIFLPSASNKPAASLLFLDFVISPEIQVLKLQVNGSRSARTDLKLKDLLDEKDVARLIPDEQYPVNARQHVPIPVKTLGKDWYEATIVGQ